MFQYFINGASSLYLNVRVSSGLTIVCLMFEKKISCQESLGAGILSCPHLQNIWKLIFSHRNVVLKFVCTGFHSKSVPTNLKYVGQTWFLCEKMSLHSFRRCGQDKMSINARKSIIYLIKGLLSGSTCIFKRLNNTLLQGEKCSVKWFICPNQPDI